MVAEALAAQGEGPKFRSLEPTSSQTQYLAAVFPALLQREGREGEECLEVHGPASQVCTTRDVQLGVYSQACTTSNKRLCFRQGRRYSLAPRLCSDLHIHVACMFF